MQVKGLFAYLLGGVMETKNIYRNLLSIYKYFPTLISSIDRLVEVRSVNSSNYHFSFLDTTTNQANAILSLMDRKVLLINLRVATNTVLEKMRTEQAKLLILRYIDGFSVKYISEKLGINLRTCFRKLNTALSSFSAKMGEFIFNNENVFLKNNKKTLDCIFENLNNWNICDDCEGEDVKNMQTIICNSIFKQVKKTSFCN